MVELHGILLQLYLEQGAETDLRLRLVAVRAERVEQPEFSRDALTPEELEELTRVVTSIGRRLFDEQRLAAGERGRP